MIESDLVQPIIVVDAGLSHEEIVCGVAAASVRSLLEVESPSWEEWLSGSFTKTVRKTDASGWSKIVDWDWTQAIFGGSILPIAARPPLTYAEFSRPLKKSRVQGLDAPRSGEWPKFDSPINIWINSDIEMSTGKTAAQVAHALMAWALNADQFQCNALVAFGYQFNCKEVSGDVFSEKMPDARVIIDAGLTEISANTATTLVFEEQL